MPLRVRSERSYDGMGWASRRRSAGDSFIIGSMQKSYSYSIVFFYFQFPCVSRPKMNSLYTSSSSS
jgi:hypothetical protein